MAQEHVVLSADRYQRLMEQLDKNENGQDTQDETTSDNTAFNNEETASSEPSTRGPESETEAEEYHALLPPGIPVRQAKRKPQFPSSKSKNDISVKKAGMKKKTLTKKKKKTNLMSLWITSNKSK